MASNYISELTVESLKSKYSLSQGILEEQCSDDLILKAADILDDWETIAPRLGITDPEVNAILQAKPALQRRKFLQFWVKKYGCNATYSQLLNALLESKLGDIACKISRLLTQDPATISAPSSKPLAENRRRRDSLVVPKKLQPPSDPIQIQQEMTRPSTFSSLHLPRTIQLESPSSPRSAPFFAPYQSQISSGEAELSEEHARIEDISAGFSADVDYRHHDLFEKFSRLIDEVRVFIRSNGVKLKYVTESLEVLPCQLRPVLEKFLEERRKLLDIKSFDELFNFLAVYWSEMRPELLIHLIDRLQDPALIRESRVYKEQLNRFKEITTINEMAGKLEGKGYPRGQNVDFQLPDDKSSSTLSYVDEIIDKFKFVTDCISLVSLKLIRFRSVHIILTIACPLDQKVFDSKKVQDFFYSYNILSVCIEEECVFKNTRMLTSQISSDWLKSEDPQTHADEATELCNMASPLEKRELEVLLALQKTTLPVRTSSRSDAGIILPDAGCRVYHEIQYMLIISDGNINPGGVTVAKRRLDETFVKKVSKNKALNIQGLSQSAALDLKTVADKIALSNHKELTSLKLDIAGEERPKEYYLRAIDTFIRECKHPAAFIWYMGHGEKDTGNWCFKDGTISLKEIFDIYKRNQDIHKSPLDSTLSENLLVVFSDCSYSGNWVHHCAEIMDEEKILPCGHQSYQRSLQVRVQCSTEPDQEAHALYYSTKGIVASKKGDFSYQDVPLSPSQNPYTGDFTKLVCLRDKEENCRMDEDIKDWTWTDVITGKLRKSIYIIQGSRNNKKCWYIILLFNRGNKHTKKYEAEVKKRGTINTADWGYVLQSGSGRTPPKSILHRITQWTFV